MKFEQKVVIKIVDGIEDTADVYDDFGLDDCFDADGLSSAEEAFMRGYNEEANFDSSCWPDGSIFEES